MRKSGSNSSVTIRDIAKEAGFAASTVSIVLNNAPLARYIRAATKQRIQDVARKLGYRSEREYRLLGWFKAQE